MKCLINNEEKNIGATSVLTPPYNGYSECKYVISRYYDSMNIELQYDEDIETAIVRPMSLNVEYTYDKKRIFIKSEKACNLSVEINGGTENAVMLFLTEHREEPESKYTNIIRFDEGIHNIDELKIEKDNTAVYIDENAFVNGKITVNGADNFKLFGMGVISMKDYFRGIPEEMTRCVDIQNCKNADISDVCIFDSCNWSLRIKGCENVKINNVKIIGSRGNSDGIDVCGSRNVHVNGCFIRTYDDSFVVKAFDEGNVENLLFENSTLWNDMARPMEVGVELRCDYVRNVTFRNIDVIHSFTSYPMFGIHHGDRADVGDIYFEDIRIENAPGAQLFDFRITDSVWNQDSKKGNIHDIYVKNISLVGTENSDFRNLQARIECFDRSSCIRNVSIDNITAFGKKVCSKELLGLAVKGNVEDVILQNSEELGEVINTKLDIVKPFVYKNDGKYHGKIRLLVENNTGNAKKAKVGINVFPRYKAEADDEFECLVNKDFEKEYDIALLPGKYVIESFGNLVEFKSDILYLDLEYLLDKSTDAASKLYFNNYYGDCDGNIRFALNNGWLEMRSELLKQYNMVLYTAEIPEMKNNQMVFAVEETYFGEAPAVKWENGEYVTAPEIGNHWEITYVFKNQPAVKRIKTTELPKNADGMIKIPLEVLGVENKFLLEAELKKENGYAMPYTLFRSTLPKETAHMFCEFKCKGE